MRPTASVPAAMKNPSENAEQGDPAAFMIFGTPIAYPFK